MYSLKRGRGTRSWRLRYVLVNGQPSLFWEEPFVWRHGLAVRRLWARLRDTWPLIGLWCLRWLPIAQWLWRASKWIPR